MIMLNSVVSVKDNMKTLSHTPTYLKKEIGDHLTYLPNTLNIVVMLIHTSLPTSHVRTVWNWFLNFDYRTI